MSNRDNIYANHSGPVPPFEFDASVADVFDDMIRRSVPGYATTLSTIGMLAARYARAGTRCYDLGCSLGAATLAMRRHIASADIEIVAVDNSAAMVQRCRAAVTRDAGRAPVTVVAGDILTTPLTNASVVVLNFTLQFIQQTARKQLMDSIYSALVPGGVLLVSEKIRFADPALDALMDALHRGFKQQQGYSELEISRKRAAIENVLVADTLDEHRSRLSQAGFKRCECWLQCFNFASMIAFRDH